MGRNSKFGRAIYAAKRCVVIYHRQPVQECTTRRTENRPIPRFAHARFTHAHHEPSRTALPYHRVAPSFGSVVGSNASTRSISFGMPSVFEIKSTPSASHRASGRTSVSVNKITGVFGRSFLKTVAASAPFNLGIARSNKIKSGRDDFAFSIASRPSTASRTVSPVYRVWSKSRTDSRTDALSSAMSTVLSTKYS